MDSNGKGKLDYGEFVAVSLHLQKMANDEHLKRAFSYFDKDGNGYIDPDELRKALVEDGAAENVDVANDILQEIDTDKVRQLIPPAFSPNFSIFVSLTSYAFFIQDGRVSYEEFAAMMKTGTDWRKASRHYSRGRFNNLSIRLMKDGSLNMESE